MFSTDAIVLKKTLIRDNKGFCELFTKDFGKVTAWITESKIKTPIDIGGIINVQIKVEGTKNTLQSYKIKRSVQYSTLAYIHIKNILGILTLIHKTIPEGLQNTSIYDDYMSGLPYLENIETNSLAKNLIELKLTKYLGISLPIAEYSDTFQKIYTYIDRVKLTDLIEKSKTLTILDELQAYIEKSLGKYLD